MGTQLKLWLLVVLVAASPVAGWWLLGGRDGPRRLERRTTANRTLPDVRSPVALRVLLPDGSPARNVVVGFREFEGEGIDDEGVVALTTTPPTHLLRTDESGAVDAARLGVGRWTATAEHRGLVGQAFVMVARPENRRPEYRPYLALTSHRLLEVEVRDSTGRPAADVCVALFSPDDRRRPPAWASGPLMNLGDVSYSRTGPNGCCRFLIDPVHEGFGRAPRIGAAAKIFGRPGLVSSVTSWDDGRARIVISIPKVHAVRLDIDRESRTRVRWGAGRNPHFDTSMSITWLMDARRDLGWLSGRVSQWSALLPPGQTRINGFVPNSVHTFEADPRGLEGDRQTVRVYREEHPVRLMTGTRPAWIRWTATTPEGHPIPPREYVVFLRSTDGEQKVLPRPDDAERVALPADSEGTLEFRPRNATWKSTAGSTPLATLALPRLVRDQPHDLGPLTFHRPPFILGGRLMDEDGSGKGGVFLTLTETPDGERIYTRTTPDGRFEFRGAIEGNRFNLRATGASMDPVDAVRGQRSITLTARPTGGNAILIAPIHEPVELKIEKYGYENATHPQPASSVTIRMRKERSRP